MKAYEKLKFYQNICDIRKIIYKLTERFSKHIRLVSQMRDAIRSAKQNIIEGYSKDSAGEFLHSIKISKGSLNEAEGDINDCFEDKLINESEHQNLKILFQTTNYQMGRYMDSLIKLDRKGLWKKRWSLQPKATNCNLKVTSPKVTLSNLSVTSGTPDVTLRNLPKSNLKRGSALIITLLIITVISAIGFGIGRLTIAEIKQSTRMEDSVGAESAAESGIEYGLLLYRYNHDVQLSKDCPDASGNCNTIPTGETINDAKNFDLGNGASFDLKIYYKASVVGNPDDIDNASNPILSQDNTLEIRGDQPFTFKYTTPCSSSVRSNPSDTLNGKKCAETASLGSTLAHGVEIKAVNSGFYSLPNQRLDDLPIDVSSLSNDDIVRIKPWNTDIRYVAQVNMPGAKMDAGITYIESTGYFGNTKRKLQTKINRASGSLLGIFDFVLYSGTGNIDLK
jgi:four helix bundle protein